MKKIASVFAVLTVLLGVITITGCDLFEDVKDRIEDKYDTWYMYNNNGKKYVQIQLDSSDEGETEGLFKNAQVFIKFNPDDGLDVLICSTQQQTISFLGGAYTTEAEMTTGATKNYPPSTTINTASFLAMLETKKFEKEDPPKIDMTLEQVLNGKFNLKRFLVQLLAGKLLEDE